MKHNWEYKRLGDVSVVIGGSTPKTDVEEYWNGNLNWFTPAEINENKYYSTSERKITPEAVKATGLTLMPAGTVLLTSRAPIGKVGIATEDFYCNQGFKNFVCKDGLLNEYLYYALIYFKEEIKGKGRGATFKEISKKVTEAIEIPVPPMEVQQQIVAELDKINEVIEDCRALLRNLDALAQSLFYDYFGDPVSNPKVFNKKHLKDIASVKIGPFGSLLHKEDYISGGTPLVNPIHMQNGYVLADNDFTIDDNKKVTLSNYLLKNNDIVFGRRGDIGRCALITASEDGYLCGTGSLFVRFSISINSLFALWCFMQPSVRKFLIDKAKGATMLNINCGIVESIPVILPPLELQEKFAERIKQIEEQKKTVEETIESMQTLLDSRMNYWFND